MKGLFGDVVVLQVLCLLELSFEERETEREMTMEYESNNWIWEWMYNTLHLFGGLMLTAALLGFSTSYFGGIGNFPLSYAWSNLGFLLKKKREKRRIRVYMDGCFDLMHYGHANALRQAKALGDELVVGVVSDEEIIANKGPPILSMEERYEQSLFGGVGAGGGIFSAVS